MLKRFWMGILTILCSIGITIAISYAWFVNGYDVDPLATGSSKDAYYYSGDGSSGKPFIITNARHLYNLAWLQYLGYYNKPSEVTNGKYKTYYFQLGIDAEHPVTLDMTNWPLPPIGTTKYPFIGNFNGNGSTIENLTTTNNFSEFGNKHPSTVTSIQDCNVIGFFGSVGAFDQTVINGTVQTETNSVGDDNEITSFYLNNSSVHTKTSSTCIGAVAGYVNTTVSDVGVIQPHLNIQDANGGTTFKSNNTHSNLSDFAVVGYAENAYKTEKTKSSTIIYNPTYNYTHFNFKGMGNQNDWGGSMNMQELYDRIVDIIPAGDGLSTTYVTDEIKYVNMGNKSSETVETTDTTLVSSSSNTENGNYAKYNRTSSLRFNYLKSVYKNVITITKNDNTENGYIISDINEEKYLDINSTRASTSNLNFNVTLNSQGSNNGRVWVLSGNKLYTYNEDDSYKYYLNATTTALSISTTGSTNWYYDSEHDGIYFSTGGYDYYLKYYNGSWCTTPLYVITDGNGNYIKMSSNNNNNPAVANTRTESEATVWDFGTAGINPSGVIRTYYSGTSYYLRLYNNNLVTSTSSTPWSNSGAGLYNGTNYIQFKNDYWVANENTSYKISYSTHYLSTTGSDATETDAALWTFSDNLQTSGGSGTISIRLNSNLRYLTNNNGNLTVSTTATTWYNEGGNLLYSIINNQKYYLEYNSGWVLNVAEYYIKDATNNYLTYDTATSIKNENSATTLWRFSNNGQYPSGIITCQNGNNTYYLDHSGTTITLSNEANTTWSNDGDGLYCTINGIKHYLVYDNGWKLQSYSLFKIHSGTNYLSIDGSGNIINSNEGSAVEWSFSNSGVTPSGMISSNGYYLYINANGVLDTTNTQENALTFNNDGTGLYDANANYLQYYNSKWVCGKSFKISYEGNYLNTTNGSSLSNTTTEGNASVWFFYNQSSNSTNGYLYTVNNGNIVYLNSGNNYGLTLNNSTSTWYIQKNGITQGTPQGDPYYIQYLNSTWYYTNGVTISYNDRYLNFGNGSLNTASSTTASTFWYFDSSSRVYTVYNGDNYYLKTTTGNKNPTLSCATGTNNNPLVYNDGKLYFYDYYNYYYYYLNLNNTTWRTSRTSKSSTPPTLDYYYFPANNTDYDILKSISISSSSSTNTSRYQMENMNSLTIGSVVKKCDTSNSYTNYSLSSGTINTYTRSQSVSQPSVFNYIPLNVDDDNTVANNNTGYIMSSNFETSSYKADIRVSEYYISNINQNSSYINTKNGNFVSFKENTIRTVNASGIQTIYDTSNSFVKYKASKEQLSNTLSNNGANDNQNLYGLHFMNSNISTNNLIVAPRVLINGEYYNNYQMPQDAIDFQVASKGYINFFAGTYFKNNNSFFSLHEIIRDANYNITAIKHISQIWKATSLYGDDYKTVDYVYKYDDNSWSGGIDVSGLGTYELAFDKSWIETPGTASDIGYSSSGDGYGRVFYFEIPVNKGEFALGSVSGRTGAYLFYLDIGANAAPVDRTEIKQQTTTTKEGLVYVKGIQILATGSTYSSDANSAVAIITKTNATAANGSDIDITRSSDTITFSTALNSTYKDESITLSGGTLAPVSTQTVYSKVLKYVDYNRSTDKLYYTTIYNNGSANTSYDCYSVNKSTGVKTQITDTSDQAEWGLLKIVNGSGTPTNDVTDSAFTFTTSTTTTILDYYTYIDTSALTTLTQTIEMSVSEDTVSTKPTDGDYLFEHIYELVGDAIIMAPNGLVVYIGPDLKASATITGPTSNVVTVTTEVNNVTYTFTFNADAINETAKTITIFYEVPETP